METLPTVMPGTLHYHLDIPSIGGCEPLSTHEHAELQGPLRDFLARFLQEAVASEIISNPRHGVGCFHVLSNKSQSKLQKTETLGPSRAAVL